MLLFLTKAKPTNNVAFECSKNCKLLRHKKCLVSTDRPNLNEKFCIREKQKMQDICDYKIILLQFCDF